MLSRLTAAAVAPLLGMTTFGSPVGAATGPWVSRHGDAGQATVSTDRKKITVCDHDRHDQLRFKADYATDNPIDPTIYSVVAPQGGCADDRTYISWIKVFKLCVGHTGIGGRILWDDCNTSVWPRP